MALLTLPMIMLFFAAFPLCVCADDIASRYKQNRIFLVSISMQYIQNISIGKAI